MKVVQVSARYERKVGDPRPNKWGSVGSGIEYVATLEPGEDPQQATAKLKAMAKAEVKAEILGAVKKMTRQLDDIFEHLPEEVQQQILALMNQEVQR